MSTQTMAIITGVLLGVVIIGTAIVLMLPSKTHDPQDGMAIGCLMLFICAMLVPAGLLIFAVVGNHPTLMKSLFWLTVIPVGWALVAFTADKTIKAVRKRRWEKSGS